MYCAPCREILSSTHQVIAGKDQSQAHGKWSRGFQDGLSWTMKDFTKHDVNRLHILNVKRSKQRVQRAVVSLREHQQFVEEKKIKDMSLEVIPDVVVVHYLHFLVSMHIGQRQLASHLRLLNQLLTMVGLSHAVPPHSIF